MTVEKFALNKVCVTHATFDIPEQLQEQQMTSSVIISILPFKQNYECKWGYKSEKFMAFVLYFLSVLHPLSI